MKQLAILLLAGAALCSSAQTLNVKEGAVTYTFPSTRTGVMNFDGAGALEILSRSFTLDNVEVMYVDDAVVEENVVSVSYTEAGASIVADGCIARYLTISIDGTNVSIAQSADVAAETCGEITYRLSGSASDGSFSISGSYKTTIELAGLDLTSSKGAPLDIQIGKRIGLNVVDGTENHLADCENGSQKGCLVSKGHLEFKGTGSLTVAAHTAHGVYAKEYIEFAKASLTVSSAIKDGINCNQYFKMKSGEITVNGTGDDAIQVSFKDDTDRQVEDTGGFICQGGKINAESTADASKAIKADGFIEISGGELILKVTGNGVFDSAKNKTKASSCLNTDGYILITDGKINLTATGGGGKGINCDSTLTVDGGDITIHTSGGIVAYVNNVLYTNYTGNTDRLDSDMKSSPKGIKADGDVVINGGTFNITCTGNGAEGIESKSTLTINDGIVNVNSKDDGLNSSSHMYIKGGTVTVVATGNDGLDSNGNLYISGGTVMAFGASSPECGLDANEEEGYTVIFTGGYILAVGGGNSVPSASSGSTQPYVSGSGSVTAGSTIRLNSGSETLAEFTVPSNYSGSGSSQGGWGGPGGGMGGGSILVSCPGLTSGTSYTLLNGSSSSNVTAVTSGNSGGGGRPW